MILKSEITAGTNYLGLIIVSKKLKITMKSKRYKELPKHFNLQPYKPSRKAGVTAFEIGDDYVIARFQSDEDIYLYNDESPGREDVEQMKNRARADKGLSTYINTICEGKLYSQMG